jgi:hypothetical protein
LLPEGHINYRAYVLTVARHGGNRWTVTQAVLGQWLTSYDLAAMSPGRAA